MASMKIGKESSIIIPRVVTQEREYITCGLVDNSVTITDRMFALFDAPIYCISVLSSKLHWVWVNSVCGKLKTDPNYSNTLGWNTFPIPKLTAKNIDDMTEAAIRILDVREKHFPASLADLYAKDAMPDDLRAAHEWNDEVVERIFIGRKFKNDSERLEKLYEMYAKLTQKATK